ncbi:hypothetical protein [Nitratifractor salsuginis]|uniref:Uncharacterized protein n=1 Tax=Nitratifractor salsuginis (strain DSM 16511 / JCM 12458 / E9I37-1) TaxID=749222 RepID=E6WZA8_NITSE|nr:hypothetical protein [Nitratifractor salsuginis]ADV46620.1 hypothetical protein Nitsa_1369 [Nitratifractor salsuginis DSM 16511]
MTSLLGEYINGGLMLMILVAAFWILKSPKKKGGNSDSERK